MVHESLINSDGTFRKKKFKCAWKSKDLASKVGWKVGKDFAVPDLKTKSAESYHRRALHGEGAIVWHVIRARCSPLSFGLFQSFSSKNGVDVLWSDSSRLGNLPTSRKGWWRFLDSWVVSGTTFVFRLFCFACVADWSEQTKRLYQVLCVFCFTTFSRTSLPHSFSSLYVPQLWSPLWGHVRLCVLLVHLGPHWPHSFDVLPLSQIMSTDRPGPILSLALCQLANSSPNCFGERIGGPSIALHC